MKNKWLKRSLSILFKLLLLALSLWFLFDKLDSKEFEKLYTVNQGNTGLIAISFFLLWVANLLLDALFWQKVQSMLEKLTLLRSLKINFICYSLNFVAPVQGGDFAGRYIMMGQAGNRKKSFFLNIWMYLPKFFARFLMAALALAIVLPLLNIVTVEIAVISVIITWGLLLFGYFSLKKLQQKLQLKNIRSLKLENYLLDGRPKQKEKAQFLGIAILRFLTFNTQFALILILLSPETLPFSIWFTIPVYYLVSSLIPSFAFADFILKGAIAVWIFQPIFDNEALFVATSLIIWLANVALPSFGGLYFILKTDIYTSLKKKFSRESRNEHVR